MITKSKILLNLQCPKRMWLSLYKPEIAIDEQHIEAKKHEGDEVGIMARSLYPEGFLIADTKNQLAIQKTKKALAKSVQRPLFEAAFLHDHVFVRSDLLIPEYGSYRLEEVKSSTKVKPYHIQDAAIQNWVLEGSGHKPTRVLISYINNKFNYEKLGDYQGLFSSEDVTETVKKLSSTVAIWVDEAKATINKTEEPLRDTGRHCKEPFECPFIDHCSPKNSQAKFPLSILPNASKLREALLSDGYKCLTDVPDAKLTNEKHKRILRVSKSGELELDAEASKILNQLSYPWFFLDFETIAYAVPRWIGTHPYMQVPFQWSCHIKRTADCSIEKAGHKDFLDITGKDPRENFIKSLLEAVEKDGTIFVYNESFEKSRIKELQRDFPKYTELLDDINLRIFDLLKIARDYYYHPDMMGSWSIKAVLPTVYAGETYKDLAVKNGTMAQDEYLLAILPHTTDYERKKIDKKLRDYCAMDTLSMWRVADSFIKY